MKYFAAVAALIAAVKAASLGNTNYDTITAGQTFTISWYGAQGAVTVDLRNGASTNLQQLLTVTSGASSTDGVGSFSWTVPTSLNGAGPYALVITDSAGVNYSPQFPITGVTVGGDSTTTTAAAVTTTATTADTTKATTAATTTTKSVSADTVQPVTTSSATHSFESEQTSSFVVHSSTLIPTTLSTKVSTTGSSPTTVPTSVPESKAVGMASPLALVLVSVAAMFYLQ